jgi:putative membrane protein
MYYERHYWGMHFFWWMFWLIMVIWIFATPYDIPMRRTRLQSPLNILKKRLAKGEITKEEYYERKRILEEKEQK